MTDREKLTVEIERVCAITGKQVIEKEHSLEVIGGPKYLFTAEGEIRSIIRGGQSFGPHGKGK